MANTNILVVGGTGTVGREVVGQLVRWGRPVRVLARDAVKARALFGRDVEIASGDLRDPASLTSALAGVECASLATAPSLTMHEE